jgi:phosphoribosyl 1,2-cyclic phosphodiesterase
MVEVCAIASGSNGNSYYIGNDKDAILIDVGINCKQMLLRLQSRNLDPSKIRAAFISHEHTDHIAGARVFCNKHNIPAFFTKGTFDSMTETQRPSMFRFMRTGEAITLGPFSILPFKKSHDAIEPCSFTVSTRETTIGVFTDIGHACDEIVEKIKECHVLFLETNYDETMLWNGPYPWPLKKRIASEHGHLSNKQAFDLVNEHAGEKLHTLFLSHLSGENNTPANAFEMFTELHSKYNIITTSRHEASEIFRF